MKIDHKQRIYILPTRVLHKINICTSKSDSTQTYTNGWTRTQTLHLRIRYFQL